MASQTREGVTRAAHFAASIKPSYAAPTAEGEGDDARMGEAPATSLYRLVFFVNTEYLATGKHAGTYEAVAAAAAPGQWTRLSASDGSGETLCMPLLCSVSRKNYVIRDGVPGIGVDVYRQLDYGWAVYGAGFVPFSVLLAQATPGRMDVAIRMRHESVDFETALVRLDMRDCLDLLRSCGVSADQAGRDSDRVKKTDDVRSKAACALGEAKYADVHSVDPDPQCQSPDGYNLVDACNTPTWPSSRGHMPFTCSYESYTGVQVSEQFVVDLFTAACDLRPVVPSVMLHMFDRLEKSLDERDSAELRQLADACADVFAAFICVIATTRAYQTDYIVAPSSSGEACITSNYDRLDFLGLRQVGDCEDFARAMSFVFNELVRMYEGGTSNSVIKTLGKFASHYQACGLLCIVSRMAAGNESYGATQVGDTFQNAHMTLLLLRKSYLGVLLDASAAGTAGDAILPHCMLAEGTGATMPFFRESDATAQNARFALSLAVRKICPALSAYADGSRFFKTGVQLYVTSQKETREYALVYTSAGGEDLRGVPIQDLANGTRSSRIRLMPMQNAADDERLYALCKETMAYMAPDNLDCPVKVIASKLPAGQRYTDALCHFAILVPADATAHAQVHLIQTSLAAPGTGAAGILATGTFDVVLGPVRTTVVAFEVAQTAVRALLSSLYL